MKHGLLWISAVLLVWACGLINRPLKPTSTTAVPPTMEASNALSATATSVRTSAPATLPSPSASDTPNTFAGLPDFYGNVQDMSQYLNPNGLPVADWQGVPIMPQATAAQDFNNGVYSYKATATLKQASAFYSSASIAGDPPLPPMSTGSGGSGSLAAHDATFIYPNLLIFIRSYDFDVGHVIVVISK